MKNNLTILVCILFHPIRVFARSR